MTDSWIALAIGWVFWIIGMFLCLIFIITEDMLAFYWWAIFMAATVASWVLAWIWRD